ncbi:hypothetical protein TWF481_009678 [Arthrobotrys musiformis]|uniref:NACHT domain-containing protein n=1 Tax=Arthrobotrys musiformis TaxID=47236 RepID=A0AAV9W6G3_9PEZI
MGCLCPQYDRFSKLFPKHQELQSAICEFYAIIVDFFREALEYLYKSVLKQLAIATFHPFEEKFGDTLKALNLAKETIDREITFSSQQELHIDRMNNAQLRTDVQDLCHFTRLNYQNYRDDRIQVSEAARRSKRERVLQNISKYPYYSDFTNNLQKRVENSGQWIYKTPEYESWFDSSKSAGLWYHAIPGFGKSVLTAGVVDSLLDLSRTSRKEKHYVAYFFCTYKVPSSLLAHTILSSLLHQMLYYSQNLPESLVTELESKFEDKLNASRVSLSDIQRFLAEIINSNEAKNYIIVDGLDECTDKERGIVLRNLKKLLEDASCSAKVLISSRGSQDMVRALQSFKELDLGVSNQADIEEFIPKTLRDKELEGQLPELSSDLFERVKAFLAENAKGLFIWVDLQIEEICKEARAEDIEAVLPTLPKDLDELYDRVVNRIVRLRHPELAREIFKWVAFAIRPLTIEELKEATCLRDRGLETWGALHKAATMDEFKWLQNCENLVVVNKSNKTVEFAHSTIREFLEGGKCNDASFNLSVDRHNHQIAEACVRYYEFPEITKPDTKNHGTSVSKKNINALAMASVTNTWGSAPLLNWAFAAAKPVFTYLSQPPTTSTSTALVRTTGTGSTTITTQKQTFKSLLRTHTFLEYATSSWLAHYLHYFKFSEEGYQDLEISKFLYVSRRICNLAFQKFEAIRFPWQNYFTPESSTFREDLFHFLDWALENKIYYIFDIIWECAMNEPSKVFHQNKVQELFLEYWLPTTEADELTPLYRMCFTDGFAREEIWRHVRRVIECDVNRLFKRDIGGRLSKQPDYLSILLREACARSHILALGQVMGILALLPNTKGREGNTPTSRTPIGTKIPRYKFTASKYFDLKHYEAIVRVAATADSPEILDALQDDLYIEFIRDIPAKNRFEILYLTAQVGRSDFFKALMGQRHYRTHETPKTHQSIIQRIAEIGEVEMVKEYIHFQRSLQLRSDIDRLYPIQIAAKHNHLNVIEAMMPVVDEKSVDVTVIGALDTALSYAIKNQNAEMARLLLRAGANLGLRPGPGRGKSSHPDGGYYPCLQFVISQSRFPDAQGSTDMFELLVETRREVLLDALTDPTLGESLLEHHFIDSEIPILPSLIDRVRASRAAET